QVGPVGLAVRVAHGGLGQPQLLGGSLDEVVLARPPLLDELAVGGGGVEDGRELAVAPALLVVGPADPVPVELPEDEDRRGDQERHGTVLERAPMAVPHQVVDQSLGLLGGPLVLEGLLAHRGHPRRPHDVGIGRAVLDELDRHVAAEPQLLPTVLLAGHVCLPVWAGPPGTPAPTAIDDTVARPTDSGCPRGVSARVGPRSQGSGRDRRVPPARCRDAGLWADLMTYPCRVNDGRSLVAGQRCGRLGRPCAVATAAGWFPPRCSPRTSNRARSSPARATCRPRASSRPA